MQFMIRDVLWLMVVAGLGIGWLLDHRILVPRASDQNDKRQVIKGSRNPFRAADAEAFVIRFSSPT